MTYVKLAVLSLSLLSPAFAGAVQMPTYSGIGTLTSPNMITGSQAWGNQVTPWVMSFGMNSAYTAGTRVLPVIVNATTLGMETSLTGTGRLNYTRVNQGDAGSAATPWYVSLAQGPAGSASIIVPTGTVIGVTMSQGPAGSASIIGNSTLPSSSTATVLVVSFANGGTLTLDAKCVKYELRAKSFGLSATEMIMMSPDNMAACGSGSGWPALVGTTQINYASEFGNFGAKVLYFNIQNIGGGTTLRDMTVSVLQQTKP